MGSNDPSQHDDFAGRLREGEDRAARELFARYAHRLAALAERHLSDGLAARVDGEDIVQSVFRTFFRRCGRGDFQIDSSAQLWQLLVKITVRKARARARQHTAEVRDVRSEAADPDSWLAEALAREPGPDEAAILVDWVGTLLQGLPDLYSRVLEMRLEGRSVAEIAGDLNLSRQTVYRALHLLSERLEMA
jgi:RNA polymerase sigma-70 factor (ECF subfamily)